MSIRKLARQSALIATVAPIAGVAWANLRLRPRPSLPPPSEPGRHRTTVADTRCIVPGPGLPAGVSPGSANNNLDAVRHSDGFVYLAFRTAPHHFATAEAAICVVRSRDEIQWTLEARYALGTDLREPRLLSLGDTLFLYVSRLGADAFAFEPRGLAVAARHADGQWSPLAPIGPPAVMGWRVRKLAGVPAFFVYSGGESIYQLGTPRLRVELWRSEDGRSWRPFDPEHPALYEGGGSEADAVLGDDGTLYGVIRNEAGDRNGWGAQVCRAPAGAPARWQCRADRRKFDSPCMFWHDGEAYLVARRNLHGTGEYDLGAGRSRLLRTVWNQVNYSLTPKRSALWRYVQGEDRFAWLLDLPSRGDCSFAAVIDGTVPNERVVYDYSSPIDGPDLPWLSGQRRPTRIYRHVLRFAAAR